MQSFYFLFSVSIGIELELHDLHKHTVNWNENELLNNKNNNTQNNWQQKVVYVKFRHLTRPFSLERMRGNMKSHALQNTNSEYLFAVTLSQ